MPSDRDNRSKSPAKEDRVMRDTGLTVEPPSGPALGLTRAYQRRPEVEAEIRALPDPADPTFLAVVQAAQAPETVVYAIRALLRVGVRSRADALADGLIGRAAPHLARAARAQFPRSESDQDDLMQMATVQMWREVFDTGSRQEFWEVFFRRMVVLTCSDAADRLRAQRAHERPFRRGVSDEGDTWSEEDMLADPHEADTSLFLPEALAQLDGDVRRAVYLKLLGFKEGSKDAEEVTISRLLGVSDRTVRTYLRRGEQTIRDWLAAGG
jgi:DNA-directed RNA polymerase specialized sigma24 family protein